jgi:hypothetical protein
MSAGHQLPLLTSPVGIFICLCLPNYRLLRHVSICLRMESHFKSSRIGVSGVKLFLGPAAIPVGHRGVSICLATFGALLPSGSELSARSPRPSSPRERPGSAVVRRKSFVSKSFASCRLRLIHAKRRPTTQRGRRRQSRLGPQACARSRCGTGSANAGAGVVGIRVRKLDERTARARGAEQ